MYPQSNHKKHSIGNWNDNSSSEDEGGNVEMASPEPERHRPMMDFSNQLDSGVKEPPEVVGEESPKKLHSVSRFNEGSGSRMSQHQMNLQKRRN